MPTTPTNSKAVVICSNRHSHGALLAAALQATGQAGKPDEYFDADPDHRRQWTKSLGIASDRDYFEAIIAEGSTPNGVFGLQLAFYQIPSLIHFHNASHAALAAEERPHRFHEIFTGRFAETHLIWLRRRDKAAQAIADYRASLAPPGKKRKAKTPPAEFDYDAIDRRVRLLEADDLDWQRYFTAYRLKASMLFYEDLVAAFERNFHTLCEVLGISDPGQKMPELAAPVEDEESLVWKQRYVEIRRGKEAERAAAQPAAAASPSRLIAYEREIKHGFRLVQTPHGEGWLVLSPSRIELEWSGAQAVRVNREAAPFTVAQRSQGMIAFQFDHIFAAKPGFRLWIRGPGNPVKDGIAPQESITAGGAASASFAVSWKFTRPNHKVIFEPGEAIALIIAIADDHGDRTPPEILPLSQNPELAALYRDVPKVVS